MDVELSSTVSTFQAIEQGLDAVVLTPGAIVRTAGHHDRRDRKKGAIKSLKGLEGKRVAVNVIKIRDMFSGVLTLATQQRS